MSFKTPAHHLARQRLHRAIVSLPTKLCPKDEPLHERIVFFDGPRSNAGEFLETLLAQVWHVNTDSWRIDGEIYNIQSADDLIAENVSDDTDKRLFEVSWGGPDGTTFANPDRVDIFTAPILKARLQAVLDDLNAEVAA